MKSAAIILALATMATPCSRKCKALGYQFFAEDAEGCICAEHVEDLHVISNLTAKLVEPATIIEHPPKPPGSLSVSIPDRAEEPSGFETTEGED